MKTRLLRRRRASPSRHLARCSIGTGGTVLIGVQDKGNIPVGIERDLDRLKTPDALQRKVQETFGVKLKPDPSDLVRISFPDVEGVGDTTGTVPQTHGRDAHATLMLAKIEVTGDPRHAYELNGDVYLRRDGESRKLTGNHLTAWWTRRQVART
ncbi:MAG: RNA-binding domain-containing protein [Fimbriimonadales bacterium]